MYIGIDIDNKYETKIHKSWILATKFSDISKNNKVSLFQEYKGYSTFKKNWCGISSLEANVTQFKISPYNFSNKQKIKSK